MAAFPVPMLTAQRANAVARLTHLDSSVAPYHGTDASTSSCSLRSAATVFRKERAFKSQHSLTKRAVQIIFQGRTVAAAGGPAGPVESDVTIDVEAVVKNEKVLVLGGNGFVGSAVARMAVGRGVDVVCLNRSGRPSVAGEPWMDQVVWETGDVFSVDWSSLLADVDVVVSCIGGFGTNEQMERINGDATVVAVKAAKQLGVRRFVFVSVHDYNLPDFAKNNGYFNGKRRVETAVLDAFPDTGIILRPGFIYGKRRVASNVEVPLDLIGQPLDRFLAATKDFTKIFSLLPASDLLLAPPVDVEELAKVAVQGVVDGSMAGVFTIDEIKAMAASL